MLTLDHLKTNRGAILACAKRHGASSVRVFGSVARGKAHLESDVDFLVNFEPDRSLFDHVGLIQELTALLGVEVDVVSEKGISPLLRDRIFDEALPL